MYEFHISKNSRDKYRFDQSIFEFNGNAILVDFRAARNFAGQINNHNRRFKPDAAYVRPGDINAMGLIDEILHALIAEYRQIINPAVFQEALNQINSNIGEIQLVTTLNTFLDQFPPTSVYNKHSSVSEYILGATNGRPHIEISLEEMLLLWLSNENPALSAFEELFKDQAIRQDTAYCAIISLLDQFFDKQTGFGPQKLSLFNLLRQPALKHPDSLSKQLEFLIKTYPKILGKYKFRYLRSLDLMREENKTGITGPGPAQSPDFKSDSIDEETEKFSPDRDWMPTLVLIAKNAFVWLDQLSKKHGQRITRLDQIPEEEIIHLANMGISGLWLIGLWDRSAASKKIKHLTGNLDAVSSAYSLYDYTISDELGGDPALDKLRQLSWKYGIRLAADMVPNHTGIYSKWIREHPEWFIYLDHPPFGNYTFSGSDLSSDPNISIFLEDHYYARTDAAVVFKRVDRRTGRTHYIYHGNDGTAMPWNDTAQLNYLNPEVREAVIQTILNVARRFPVIRFDAAMTLAKKHIQRLWYPEPGHGGAIPSRAEHSLPKMRFDELIPEEFWREVVDRIAKELPDTLLLAEAFWLMEGYFVRTLGMHRVYNSAFMNMLRDEKNAEYRLVIKNTLEFDPQILKRYVNFMNNPDEETALEQFGKDGKYFGTCVLMSTMPGLPMFGHGQFEGFKEKYGMEYQRAYYDEQPDQNLIQRHQREIAPLLLHRHLFSEVENFLLYDVYTANGAVNEDVYAFSNNSSGQQTLVFFHNRWGEVHGNIHQSAAYAVKTTSGEKELLQRRLAEGLGIPDDPSKYLIIQDLISGLEFIHSCTEIYQHGLDIHLGAFEYRVFWNFRVVQENEWSHYRMVTDHLQGRGVGNLEDTIKEVALQPILTPWRELVNEGFYAWLIQSVQIQVSESDKVDQEIKKQFSLKYQNVLEAIKSFIKLESDSAQIVEHTTSQIVGTLRLIRNVRQQLEDWEIAILISLIFSRELGRLETSEVDYQSISLAWIREWYFDKTLIQTILHFGGKPEIVYILELLIERTPGSLIKNSSLATFQSWLEDPDIARFLKVNSSRGSEWFDANQLAVLIKWVGILNGLSRKRPSLTATRRSKEKLLEIVSAMEISGYQTLPLLMLLGKQDDPARHS